MKFHRLVCGIFDEGRPPHRGAWIEIDYIASLGNYYSRPPHRGRGLKYNIDYTVNRIYGRPPHRGAWIEIRGA